eukprot:Colp12_sorted_trinity150504_noHs@30388
MAAYTRGTASSFRVETRNQKNREIEKVERVLAKATKWERKLVDGVHFPYYKWVPLPKDEQANQTAAEAAEASNTAAAGEPKPIQEKKVEETKTEQVPSTASANMEPQQAPTQASDAANTTQSTKPETTTEEQNGETAKRKAESHDEQPSAKVAKVENAETSEQPAIPVMPAVVPEGQGEVVASESTPSA